MYKSLKMNLIKNQEEEEDVLVRYQSKLEEKNLDKIFQIGEILGQPMNKCDHEVKMIIEYMQEMRPSLT